MAEIDKVLQTESGNTKITSVVKDAATRMQQVEADAELDPEKMQVVVR